MIQLEADAKTDGKEKKKNQRRRGSRIDAISQRK